MKGAIGLGQIALDGDDIYWSESGRRRAGATSSCAERRMGNADLTPPPFNARTRVHEYGGGGLSVVDEGTVYFSNFADQRLYRQDPAQEPRPITPRGTCATRTRSSTARAAG